jgi:hypothetical protein
MRERENNVTPRLSALLLAATMISGVGHDVMSRVSGNSTTVRTVNPLDVKLRIQRIASGSGNVLVSSGVPFQAGVLHGADIARVRIEVDGYEVPAYVEPLAKWRDGSVRSLLVQFQWDGASSRSGEGRLLVGTATTANRRAQRSKPAGLPDAVALPAEAEYLVQTAIAGPMQTVSMTRTLGATFGRYDLDFKRLADQHWKADAGAWEQNYYDRSLVYYVAWMRSGNIEYWRRGTTMALNYRRDYLERNNYNTSPHWAQLAGLEMHYLLTGDTLSRTAVAAAFAWGLSTFATPRSGPKADLENTQSEYMENRIQARVLQGALSAWRLKADYRRPDGPAFPASQWPARLRDMLNKILSVQRADGSYPWAQVCGGQLNYMVGMLNDVLIEYYRDFEPDPRIPAAIERANEYLWSTQWLPAEQAFKYASVNCAPNRFGANVGGMEPAGDLNGLLVGSFGWLYQHTGDAKWRTRGDAIFAGIFAPRWASNYNGSKQFNQAYTSSFRYLGYRSRRP